MSVKKVPFSLRLFVATRAKYYCEYCQLLEDFSSQSFTIEHIKPRQKGGDNTLENLAYACSGCNAFKHTKTEDMDQKTGEIVALYNPRKQVWQEHFLWSNDFTEILGKTPCGRVTINALKLNRKGLINLRRLLVTQNYHPPSDKENNF